MVKKIFLVCQDFDKSVGKMDGLMKKKTFRCIRKFDENPRRPGLHNERLRGNGEITFHSARIDRSHRMVFCEDNRARYLLNADICSPHEVYEEIERKQKINFLNATDLDEWSESVGERIFTSRRIDGAPKNLNCDETKHFVKGVIKKQPRKKAQSRTRFAMRPRNRRGF